MNEPLAHSNDSAFADQRANSRRSANVDAGAVGRVSPVGNESQGLRAKESNVQSPKLKERDEASYINGDAVDMLVIIECFRSVNEQPLTFARIMQRSGFKRDKARRMVISGKAKGWIKEIVSGKERQFIPGPRAINWAREIVRSEIQGSQYRER